MARPKTSPAVPAVITTLHGLRGRAGEAAEAAAEALGPEAELFARQDVTSFSQAFLRLGAAVATHPLQACAAGLRFAGGLAGAGSGAMARCLGLEVPPSLAPAAKDRRFRDPAWERNPWFFAERQSYLAWSRLVHDLATVGRDADESTADKAAFALGMLVDAVAPTNFLATNPAALRKAFETRGRSAAQGMQNFLADLASNRGRPRQVDGSTFEVGRNLAATPGKVVFRDDLIELIQYAPQTETVFSVPLLLTPPWINRYYVMDLAPGRSFVEWAVQHGHTVFAISFRNPDESMRHVTLEDYVLRGAHQALDVVGEITGSDAVNVAGLCIGGTLTAMLLARLAADDDTRVRSATLLNTLVDFSDPGPLGAFTDEAAVERMERRTGRQGFLDPDEMADTFNALRANDLIWSYVASNWLMGEDPPAFDILAWNADGTRMPAATHSAYLRSCYLENRLARGTMTLAGVPLRLEKIGADVYIVGAIEDHIAPWRPSYATTRLLKSPVRYVLSSSGHIAGIVNPPADKRRYWTNDELGEDPDEWLSKATEHAGTWWEDWADWIATRAGRRRQPPRLGSDAHPALGDAPGTYVHG